MMTFVIAATLAGAPVEPPAGDAESVERLNRATQAQVEARDARERAVQGDYKQQHAAHETALRQNQAAAVQAAAARRDYEAAGAAYAAAMASWQRDAARRLASAEPAKAASSDKPLPARADHRLSTADAVDLRGCPPAVRRSAEWHDGPAVELASPTALMLKRTDELLRFRHARLQRPRP